MSLDIACRNHPVVDLVCFDFDAESLGLGLVAAIVTMLVELG